MEAYLLEGSFVEAGFLGPSVASRALLGASWGLLGAFWGFLGPPGLLGPLGACWDLLLGPAEFLELLEPLKVSWDLLEASWGFLGLAGASSWGLLGFLGPPEAS